MAATRLPALRRLIECLAGGIFGCAGKHLLIAVQNWITVKK
jgi:hypothetical protein